MAGVGDPIKLGFIDSLSRPGGNMTGLATLRPELEARSFRLLAELVPGLNRFAVLLNPDNPLHDVKDAEAAAKLAGVQVVMARARKPDEFPAAFALMVKAQAGALSIWEDPVFSRYRASLVDLAMRSRLPSMFKSSADAAAGGPRCIWSRFRRPSSARCRLCRQDSERRPAERFARRATHEVRVDDKPQDGRGLGADDPTVDPASGGSRDRVSHGRPTRPLCS